MDMSNDFEKSEGCNTHEILSDNVLCCAHTGRVVAVFYRGYDLDKVLKKMNGREITTKSSSVKGHECDTNRAFDGSTCLICND